MHTDSFVEPRLTIVAAQRSQSITVEQLIERIDQFEKLIIIGPPGIGKTTLIKSLAADVPYESLLLLNQRLNPAEELQDFQWQHQEGRVLIDGLEDAELPTKVLRRMLFTMNDYPCPVVISMREALWDTLKDDELESCYSVIAISEWNQNDLDQYFLQTQIQSNWIKESGFINTPFYAQLAAGLDGDDRFNNVFELIQLFVQKEISQLAEKLSVDKINLYRFLEELAFTMRQSGSKSLDESVLYKLLSSTGLPEKLIGFSNLLVLERGLVRFRHELFLECVVARSLIDQLTLHNNLEKFGQFQTSYQEDDFIAAQIGRNQALIKSLIRCTETTLNPVLKVNILGMLAKMPASDYATLWRMVCDDQKVYALYKQAVFDRLGISNEPNTATEKILQQERDHGKDPIAALICEHELNQMMETS